MEHVQVGLGEQMGLERHWDCWVQDAGEFWSCGGWLLACSKGFL